jgi:hypothetical protein|tara:strand:+ start:3619 stop:3774 length:156 start_codon:yes stop_codon:yes gene_type:complete
MEMSKMKRTILTAALLALVAGPALADWGPRFPPHWPTPETPAPVTRLDAPK